MASDVDTLSREPDTDDDPIPRKREQVRRSTSHLKLVPETKEQREDFTELTAGLLPRELPRYLMGVGTPIDLLEAIHRGVDLFDSTLIQLYIADLLGKEEFRKATFHHHPLLRDAVGVKLSKSEGASSIRAFRAAGGRVQDLMRMT